MSRFSEEMNLIPRTVWGIAVAAYFTLLGCLFFFTSLSQEDRHTWPTGARVIFCVVLPILLFVYILLVGYVYSDARRRGMRSVMWTLLAIFIPNAIGFILYFILRDPLLQRCSKCGANVSTGFPYCPACGTALSRTCPSCRRPVQPDWSHCAHCGTVTNMTE